MEIPMIPLDCQEPKNPAVMDKYITISNALNAALEQFRIEGPREVVMPAAIQACVCVAAIIFRAAQHSVIAREPIVKLANRIIMLMNAEGGHGGFGLVGDDGAAFTPKNDYEMMLAVVDKFQGVIAAAGIGSARQRADIAMQAGTYFACIVGQARIGGEYDPVAVTYAANRMLDAAREVFIHGEGKSHAAAPHPAEEIARRMCGFGPNPGVRDSDRVTAAMEFVDTDAFDNLVIDLERGIFKTCDPSHYPHIDPDVIRAASIHAMLNVAAGIGYVENATPDTIHNRATHRLSGALHHVLMRFSEVSHATERPASDPAPREPYNPAYGSCPRCGGPIVSRERRPHGNDTCAAGHVFPSSEAVPMASEPEPDSTPDEPADEPTDKPADEPEPERVPRRVKRDYDPDNAYDPDAPDDGMPTGL